MKRLRTLSAFGLAGLVLLVGLSSRAGPFRMMGFDSLSMGQGGGEVAWGTGLGVLYSNPALLTEVDEGFSIGVFVVQPLMQVELMPRPANADVPLSFYDSNVGFGSCNNNGSCEPGEDLATCRDCGGTQDRPLPTSELRNPRADNKARDTSTYLSLGLAHTLGIEEWVKKKFDYEAFRFRLGLGILVPTSGLVDIGATYPDEREQYFTNTVHFNRFGEWSKVLSILFGFGIQPIEQLSIGVSIEGGLNVGAVLDMYIPEATVQDYALVNADFNAKPSGRLVVGFCARPVDWLSIGLVWRDRRFSKVDAEASLNLWNYHESGEDQTIPKRVEQQHLLALDFEPQEVSLAVGARFEGFSAQAAVTWNHWADYIGSHHRRAQENAVWEYGAAPDGDFAFSDTFSVRLGLGYEYLSGHVVTLGGAWLPSPVPEQVGRTSYADSDLFNASVGHRIDFDLMDHSLRLDVGLQLWTMTKTTVHKDPSLIKDEFPDWARTLIGSQPMPEAAGLQTNNPGFPGYEFGGYAFSGSMTLSYLF